MPADVNEADAPLGDQPPRKSHGGAEDRRLRPTLDFQLRRIEGSTWFDGYRRSFDAVWETAVPMTELEGRESQSLAG